MAAPQQLRDRIQFEWNEAQTVVLEDSGVPQEGRNGPEFRYFLADHCIMWVPPEVHHQIQRHTQTYPFECIITRHKTGHNQATWTVERLEDEPPEAQQQQQQTAPPPPPKPAARTTRTRKPATAARPEPTPEPPAQQQQQPAARPSPTPVMPRTQDYSNAMYTALCAAIRTAAEAEKFAQSIGRPLAFETADIRALAATLYIQHNGGGR